ncbi:MAG TPA: hypothetical protein VGO55_13990 [Allosphingosinicella sp.]|jgi:hypothetical protein|nr:hypothetical protein [Allosphingosinicella sp.]
MNLTTAVLTASAGIGGVLLGTFLRPLVEDWFALRRKTLHVVIHESSEFQAPHESVVLSWHGEDLHRLIQTGFRLENRTGRTLRNFRVEIGASSPAKDRQIHAIYLQPDSRARYSIDEDGEKSIVEFELLEPKARLSGSMLSNYTDKIDFSCLDDVEIRRTIDRSPNLWWLVLVGVGLGLVGSAANEIVTFIWRR